MKFLQVIATADPDSGGPIEGVNRLGVEFKNLGHQQELLTLDYGDESYIGGNDSKIYALGRKKINNNFAPLRLINYIRGAPRAVEWLREHAHDYDGIIVNGLWNYSTRVSLLGLVSYKSPIIVFTHGMLGPYDALQYPIKHRFKKMLFRINEGVLMKSARAVAFTCETERNLAAQAFDLSTMRLEVVGFGTTAPPPKTSGMLQAFRQLVPELGAKPYFLYLGRLHEKKGCGILIEAFSRIAADFHDMNLVMAGPADSITRNNFQLQADRCGFADRIHWPGMVSGDAKWGALYGCDAMTLPSHHENFGLSVVEALACGRPVLISDQVNIHDDVADGQGGLVGPDTTDGTEAVLRKYLALSDIERKAMGNRGAILFAERFLMRRTAQRLLDIFSNAGATVR